MHQRPRYFSIILFIALCTFVETSLGSYSESSGGFASYYYTDGGGMAADSANNILFMDGETVLSTSFDPNDNEDLFRVYGWGPMVEGENREILSPIVEYRGVNPKADGYWSIRESSSFYSTQASWYNTGAQNVDFRNLNRPIELSDAYYTGPTTYAGQKWVRQGANLRDVYSTRILDKVGLSLVGDFDGDGLSDVIQITNEDYIITAFSGGDGEFYSVFFTPWSGYGTRLGAWVVSDVNGDGKDDLQHIWGSGDYINTWISKGDGTYSIKSFRPWPGYNTSIGLWTQGDINGDGKGDLQHIWSGEYLNTWISNGDGTYQIKSTQPWADYGSSLGEWGTGDVTGDGRDDLLHIWGGDYINTWISSGDGNYWIRPFRPWSGYGTGLGGWVMSDVNGDGRGDLQHIFGGDYINTWISRGDGSYRIKSFQPRPGYNTSMGLWTHGDFNGDGRGDLQHIWGGDFINTWISKGDGTYRIKSFRPWSGYSTAIGEYHIADYDGDGMDDILHLFGGDYPYYHLWTSNGDGTFYL